LTFVFAFPVITVLVLIGSFDAQDDAFPVSPAHWYTAGYLAVVVAAVGLVMLPVHIAGYRERGVLRRFSASDFPRWSFAAAEFIVGLAVTVVASSSMLAIVGILNGIPSMHAPLRSAAGMLVGATAFISIGLLIGALAPTARSAQGIGLLAFFPVFLLGGGGPPPDAMGTVMQRIADVIPLTHVTRAIQDPWLGLGTGGVDLMIVVAIAVACVAGWWKIVRL
jgi:ABC-2 type transport system permease protein